MNTLIEKNNLIELYFRERLTTNAIANLLEVSPTYVLKALRIHGIPVRKTGFPKNTWALPIDLKKVKHLYCDEGLSIRQVSKRLGSSFTAIRLRLNRMGVMRSSSGGKRLMHRKDPRTGPRSPRWKGGRTLDHHGYVLIKNPSHPYCDRQGYVPEHRLVMEQKLGRYLLPTEIVHHVNENRQDNHPQNLQVFQSRGEHTVHHAKMRANKNE